MTDYLAVAVGGALGCMSRYAVQQMSALSADRILLIGLVATLIDTHGGYRTLRLMAVTGFLGGFTTYSTFALDTATLVRGGEVMKAFAYMAVTLAGGYGAFLIGQFSAQKIL